MNYPYTPWWVIFPAVAACVVALALPYLVCRLFDEVERQRKDHQ